MKVATWNVNSVRARLPNILNWLNDNPVDILLLQEIKCVDQEFVVYIEFARSEFKSTSQISIFLCCALH